jgi:hypothetical protein
LLDDLRTVGDRHDPLATVQGPPGGLREKDCLSSAGGRHGAGGLAGGQGRFDLIDQQLLIGT